MHVTRLRHTLTALFLIALPAAAPPGLPAVRAESLIIDRIAAVVNGDIITLSEVQEAVLQQANGRLIGSGTAVSQETAAATLTRGALLPQLRQLINRRLELQEAKRLGVESSETELTQALDDIKRRNSFSSDAELERALAAEGLTLARYREQLREELVVAKLLNREVRGRAIVPPEEARDYYDTHRQEFVLPSRVRLRQIFLAAPIDQPVVHQQRRIQAQAAWEQLRGGADFGQQARLLSDGPEAADGGELGWFQPGTLMPELDRVAFSLSAGQTSEVIESSVGWHILKVEEQEGHREQPFDEVKESVSQRLLDGKARQLHETWFLELRERAYVDIRL